MCTSLVMSVAVRRRRAGDSPVPSAGDAPGLTGARKEKTVAIITLRQASRLGGYKRPWVARILGSDPKYNLKREFVEATKTTFGGTWQFNVTDGLYELCDRNSKGAERRSRARVVDGVLEDCLSDKTFDAAVAALDAGTVKPIRDPLTEAIEAGIARINGEGVASPTPPSAQFECLECGFSTDRAHLIDAGGMGCVRCNH